MFRESREQHLTSKQRESLKNSEQKFLLISELKPIFLAFLLSLSFNNQALAEGKIAQTFEGKKTTITDLETDSSDSEDDPDIEEVEDKDEKKDETFAIVDGDKEKKAAETAEKKKEETALEDIYEANVVSELDISIFSPEGESGLVNIKRLKTMLESGRIDVLGDFSKQFNPRLFADFSIDHAEQKAIIGLMLQFNEKIKLGLGVGTTGSHREVDTLGLTASYQLDERTRLEAEIIERYKISSAKSGFFTKIMFRRFINKESAYGFNLDNYEGISGFYMYILDSKAGLYVKAEPFISGPNNTKGVRLGVGIEK